MFHRCASSFRIVGLRVDKVGSTQVTFQNWSRVSEGEPGNPCWVQSPFEAYASAAATVSKLRKSLEKPVKSSSSTMRGGI